MHASQVHEHYVPLRLAFVTGCPYHGSPWQVLQTAEANTEKAQLMISEASLQASISEGLYTKAQITALPTNLPSWNSFKKSHYFSQHKTPSTSFTNCYVFLKHMAWPKLLVPATLTTTAQLELVQVMAYKVQPIMPTYAFLMRWDVAATINWGLMQAKP